MLVEKLIEESYYNHIDYNELHKALERNVKFKGLVDLELDGLVNVLGGRNKPKLKVALQYSLYNGDNLLNDRFVAELLNDAVRWSYIAGHEYREELKYFREVLYKYANKKGLKS